MNPTHFLFGIAAALLTGAASALTAADTLLQIDAETRLQEFQGMGCGAIFYEAHLTSLGARGRTAEQTALYDAMFRDVRTDFLQLMIRHDHEPENDNADPLKPAFDLKNFAYAEHTIAICKAARARNPKIRFYATLYTPALWMKTNAAESAGGKQRATIKPGIEAELAEFCWAFLARMQRAGLAVEFLSVANEPDWSHQQPGYCLTPDSHAALVGKVAAHLDTMARRYPEVPRPAIVGPNTLSAATSAAMAPAGCRNPGSRRPRFSPPMAGAWWPMWPTSGTTRPRCDWNQERSSPALRSNAGAPVAARHARS